MFKKLNALKDRLKNGFLDFLDKAVDGLNYLPIALINRYYDIKKNYFPGIYRCYYDNGGLAVEYPVDAEGEIHGLYKSYYEPALFCKGGLECKTLYRHGKEDGLSFRFHKNGKIESRCKYKNGKITGEYISYHAIGTLKSRAFFGKAGFRDGLCEEYHENGQLESRIFYKNGIPADGLQTTYHENGQIKSRYTIKNGRPYGKVIKYHKNGQMAEASTYKNGYQTGAMICYHENGQLREKCFYKNSLKHGPFECYYENGQLKEKGTYNSDRGYPELNGLYERYHEDGRLWEKGNYIDGQKDGVHFYQLDEEKEQVFRNGFELTGEEAEKYKEFLISQEKDKNTSLKEHLKQKENKGVSSQISPVKKENNFKIQINKGNSR